MEKGKSCIFKAYNKSPIWLYTVGAIMVQYFRKCIIKRRFVLFWYDLCIANKYINGSQCTICWYVEDTKISHVDPKVITGIIKTLEISFGKPTVNRGKKHKFMGIDFEL